MSDSTFPTPSGTPAEPALPRLTRRQFLAAGLAAGAVAAIPLADASATSRVSATRLALDVPGLPPAHDGLRIAQVSDLHLHDDGVHEAGDHAAALIRRERPDLVVLTGDQWDHSGRGASLVGFLRRLPEGIPAVAILGNHEHASGVGEAEATRMHEAGGVPLLINGHLEFRLRGEPFAVVGVDDMRRGNPDLAKAVGGVRRPYLLLVHEPGQLTRPGWVAEGALMAFAGHTHGGQIRIAGVAPILPAGSGGFVSGWYPTPSGRMYVSRGVGTSTIPLRLGAPAEVPIVTLRRAR